MHCNLQAFLGQKLSSHFVGSHITSSLRQFKTQKYQYASYVLCIYARINAKMTALKMIGIFEYEYYTMYYTSCSVVSC